MFFSSMGRGYERRDRFRYRRCRASPLGTNRKYRKGEEGKLTEALTFVPVRSFCRAAEQAGSAPRKREGGPDRRGSAVFQVEGEAGKDPL